VGASEARVAAYLSRGLPPAADPISACSEAPKSEDDRDSEEGDGIRASDLPDSRLNFGDGTDPAGMSSAMAALRARLGHAHSADGAPHATPSVAELRDRLGQIEPPPGITMTEEHWRRMSDAWMAEQSSTDGAVELGLSPRNGAINLVGDPEGNIDPAGHDAPPSQVDVLNQRLLASFKDSLDRIGAGYSPMMEQISSSEPGNGEEA
jgi:hypothetical protein